MSYELSSDNAEFLEQQVALGAFKDASEGLNVAVAVLRSQTMSSLSDTTQLKQFFGPSFNLEAIRAKLKIAEEQSDRGESAPLDLELVKREVRQRLAAAGISDERE